MRQKNNRKKEIIMWKSNRVHYPSVVFPVQVFLPVPVRQFVRERESQ